MPPASLLGACAPSSFRHPPLPGAEILSVSAAPVTGYSASVPARTRTNEPDAEVRAASFCNVTVTYTHPGQGDEVNVEAWLPVALPVNEDPDSSSTDDGGVYNGRMHAFGGGGWAGGRAEQAISQMAAAVADGYAALTTDTGTGHADALGASWGLLSPGNVDLFALQNMGSVALNDASVIGKAIVEDFYGRAPEYAYFTGCSHGGRQGLALAQRYPSAYDGITAGAPAIDWTMLLSSLYWPNQVLNDLIRSGGDGPSSSLSPSPSPPHMCELDVLAQAARTQCDPLDGVTDGIVADPDACRAFFDPHALVGQPCAAGNDSSSSSPPVVVTESAVLLVEAIWNGTRTVDGRGDYPGLSPASDLTASRPDSIGLLPLVSTTCSEDGNNNSSRSSGSSNCVADLMPLGEQWVRYFLAKDADADLAALTHAQFDDLVHRGKQEFSSVMDTLDVNLDDFGRAGGKMLTFHGTDDSLIPHKRTSSYYAAVLDRNPDVRDFYRYFEIPGMNHCHGGTGQPDQIFNQLRAWVENGTVPDTTPYQITGLTRNTEQRIACPYPSKARLGACPDQARAECWSCL